VVLAVLLFLGMRASIEAEREESRRICSAYYALSRTAADSLRAAGRVVHGRPCAYYLEP
jgi:hypothetical protein